MNYLWGLPIQVWILGGILYGLWSVVLICEYIVLNRKKKEILNQMQNLNPLRNDYDQYMYDLCEFAIGKTKKRPNPRDYGIPE